MNGPPRSWVAAACAGLDTTWFYPEPGEWPRAAQAVCVTCPVRQECLDYALANHENYGIWGGTTERQRRLLHQQRRGSGA